MEKLIPNSTQIPNEICDCVLPQIPEAEARCLIYICRRTFGFRKTQDRISFSQFEKGIKTKDGNILDYGTGLSRPAVAKALKNLCESGAIKRTENSKGNFYEINLEMECSQVVKQINWLSSLTKSGKATLPKVVNLLNTQNKEKQRETKILPTKSAHAEILKFYSDLVQSKFGFRPKIDGADGKNLKSALSLGVENIRALIEWYLDSDKCRELENVSLSSCLSKDSVNKWRLIGNKPQQPIFRKIN